MLLPRPEGNRAGIRMGLLDEGGSGEGYPWSKGKGCKVCLTNKVSPTNHWKKAEVAIWSTILLALWRKLGSAVFSFLTPREGKTGSVAWA